MEFAGGENGRLEVTHADVSQVGHKRTRGRRTNEFCEICKGEKRKKRWIILSGMAAILEMPFNKWFLLLIILPKFFFHAKGKNKKKAFPGFSSIILTQENSHGERYGTQDDTAVRVLCYSNTRCVNGTCSAALTGIYEMCLCGSHVGVPTYLQLFFPLF